TLAASVFGNPLRYQVGSCEPSRRSTVPGLTLHLSVPAPSGLAASTAHIHAPVCPRTRTLSSASTAALVKKFAGTSGPSLAPARASIPQVAVGTSYVQSSVGKRL